MKIDGALREVPQEEDRVFYQDLLSPLGMAENKKRTYRWIC